VRSTGAAGSEHAGMSKDKLLRAKAKLKGYEIIEISAEGLDDDEYISMVLENIAFYVGKLL